MRAKRMDELAKEYMTICNAIIPERFEYDVKEVFKDGIRAGLDEFMHYAMDVSVKARTNSGHDVAYSVFIDDLVAFVEGRSDDDDPS